jgi:polysaccharide biosynthesis protein PelD
LSDTAQNSIALENLNVNGALAETNALTFFGVRGSAIVETIVFLSIAVMLSFVAGGGTRFSGWAVHPFWIIVLMVTVQYGLKEALMAALFSSVFLLAWNLPEQMMSESSYDYILRAFAQPLLWLAAALVLGGIRERQMSERASLVEGLRNLEDATSVVVDGYNSLKRTKEQLETRLSEERCSIVSAYNIAASLETLDEAKVMTAAEKLIRTALNPVKFSIFRFSDGGLRLKAAYGWDNNDEFSARFDSADTLTKAIVQDKEIVSIAYPDDEPILEGEGQLAGPIYDAETGSLYGMLKIEEANFLNMGIHTEEIFRITCAWIARSATNIEIYRAVREKGMGVSERKKNKQIQLPLTQPPTDNESAATQGMA